MATNIGKKIIEFTSRNRQYLNPDNDYFVFQRPGVTAAATNKISARELAGFVINQVGEFVPLAGTEADSPVTGTITFQTSVNSQFQGIVIDRVNDGDTFTIQDADYRLLFSTQNLGLFYQQGAAPAVEDYGLFIKPETPDPATDDLSFGFALGSDMTRLTNDSGNIDFFGDSTKEDWEYSKIRGSGFYTFKSEAFNSYFSLFQVNKEELLAGDVSWMYQKFIDGEESGVKESVIQFTDITAALTNDYLPQEAIHSWSFAGWSWQFKPEREQGGGTAIPSIDWWARGEMNFLNPTAPLYAVSLTGVELPLDIAFKMEAKEGQQYVRQEVVFNDIDFSGNVSVRTPLMEVGTTGHALSNGISFNEEVPRLLPSGPYLFSRLYETTTAQLPAAYSSSIAAAPFLDTVRQGFLLEFDRRAEDTDSKTDREFARSWIDTHFSGTDTLVLELGARFDPAGSAGLQNLIRLTGTLVGADAEMEFFSPKFTFHNSPAEYAADYSGDFNLRSLVDRGWVQGYASPLATTLTYTNTGSPHTLGIVANEALLVLDTSSGAVTINMGTGGQNHIRRFKNIGGNNATVDATGGGGIDDSNSVTLTPGEAMTLQYADGEGWLRL